MSNEQNTPDNDLDHDAPSPAEELAILKERARQMGIPFSGNIGLDALRKRVNAKIRGEKDDDEDQAEAEEASEAPAKPETKQQIRERLQREYMALVRCKIANLNPEKNDLPGELITVVSKYLGKVSKYIPFGEAGEKGYHIPKVIYLDLLNRKFQQKRAKKNHLGVDEVSTKLVPEYSITVLPPLTKEELAELAQAQQAAARVKGE